MKNSRPAFLDLSSKGGWGKVITPVGVTAIFFVALLLAGFYFRGTSPGGLDLGKDGEPEKGAEVVKKATFRNPDFGYEFSYPFDWTITEKDNRFGLVSFQGPEDNPNNEPTWPKVKVQFVSNVKYLALSDFARGYQKEKFQSYVASSPFDVGGKEAVRLSNTKNGDSQTPSELVFLDIGDPGELTLLFILTTDPSNELVARETLDDILASVNYFEPIPTLHWETYRNENFGIELKHPAEWEEVFEYPTSYNNIKEIAHVINFQGKISREEILPKNLLRVEIFPIKKDESAEGAFRRVVSGIPDLGKEELIINDSKVSYFKNIPSYVPFNMAIFEKNGAVYAINQGGGVRDNVFFEILRTIKFLTPKNDLTKISDGFVKLLYPNGGEAVYFGEQVEIRWDSYMLGSKNVTIRFASKDCVEKNCFGPNKMPDAFPKLSDHGMIVEATPNDGSFIWSVPDFWRGISPDGGYVVTGFPLPGDYKLYIAQATEGLSNYYDESDGYITLLGVPGEIITTADNYIIGQVGGDYFKKNYRFIQSGWSPNSYSVYYEFLPATALVGATQKAVVYVYDDGKVSAEGVNNCFGNPQLCELNITKEEATAIAASKGLNVNSPKFKIEFWMRGNQAGGWWVWYAEEGGFQDQYGCSTAKTVEIKATNGEASEVKEVGTERNC